MSWTTASLKTPIPSDQLLGYCKLCRTHSENKIIDAILYAKVDARNRTSISMCR
ncbi:MAG: hypothetical protein ACLVJ6_16480 [Merdibacter sp.]